MYDGIDPDAAKAALAELADTEIVDSDDLDKAHTAELAAVQSEKAKQVEELQAQLAAEVNAHNTTRFKQTIGYEFVRAGGRESAVDFIVGKAAEVFTMKDGKLTTKEFSTAKPGEPLELQNGCAAITPAISLFARRAAAALFEATPLPQDAPSRLTRWNSVATSRTSPAATSPFFRTGAHHMSLTQTLTFTSAPTWKV